MSRQLLLVAVLFSVVFTSGPAWTQNSSTDRSSRSFEVTSVKRSVFSDRELPPRITLNAGRYVAANSTLRAMVRHAYDVVIDAQLLGGPRWANELRFSVEATAPGAAVDEMRPMVRRLLAERFGLVLKSEKRVFPIYRLVRIPKAGSKPPRGLTAATCAQPNSAGCGLVGGGPNAVFGRGITVGRLARALTQMQAYTEIDRIVVDETGLTGTYDVEMEFSATREHPGLRVDRNPNLPAFATALQEQLGLKLEPASGSVDVWTIDSARMPSEN